MRLALRALAGVMLALASLTAAVPSVAASSWTGRYSVYTPRGFSMQHLDYTCVGASVQMMLNMIDRTTDHSAKVQLAYWRYGNDHNRYFAADQGVDPAGWVAALEHFGAGNYSINAAAHYQAGLRALASAMRATGRPIGLFVHSGGHAWVMTGFAATADPQTSATFTVTAIQVMGPLYPDGTIDGKSYDPGPGTWLSAGQLLQKFTPFRSRRAVEWNGRWVAVAPD
jgi:hypothetical protein